jgi:hypothetical protein
MHLKREKFQFIIAESHSFGPVMRQTSWQKQRRSAHLMAAREQREKGRVQDPTVSFKDMPLTPMTYLPSTGPQKLSFHHLLIAPQAGTQAFSIWAFGGHLRSEPLQTQSKTGLSMPLRLSSVISSVT